MVSTESDSNQPPASTIQERYNAAKQERYGGLKAVLGDPKIPPKGKLLLVLHGAYLVEVGAMLAFSVPWQPIALTTGLTVLIALLIFYEPNTRSTGTRNTGPPFPRPRRARKRRNRKPA